MAVDKIPEDEFLDDVVAKLDKEGQIPAGYATFRLSTKGKLGGAPEVFHMRNLSVDEAYELGTVTRSEIASKINNILQRLILEEDVQIKKFKDNEVAETLVRFFATFYQKKWQVDHVEMNEYFTQYALEHAFHGKDDQAFREWLHKIKTGKIPTSFNIDLTKLRFYKQPDEPKTKIKLKLIDDSYAIFRLPEFGDSVVVESAIKEKFSNEEKRHAQTYEAWERKQRMERALEEGRLETTANMPYIPETELKELLKFEAEKAKFSFDMMKGLYLAELDGVNYEDAPLQERIAVARDYRIDFNRFNELSKKFKEIKVGIVPKVKVDDHPITGKTEEIDYTFRTMDLLAGIKNTHVDDSDFELV